MSEKIYKWLLSFYPAYFRERYRDAALQLFRDRARDERGFFRKLQLWADLFADLAVSVPREHRYHQRTLTKIRLPLRSEGAPSFQILEGEPLRPGALLIGCVLSLAALGALPIVMSRAGDQFLDPVATVVESTVVDDVSPSVTDQPQVARDPKGPANGPVLGYVERHRVIAAAISNLKKHYFSTERARTISDSLLSHEQSGDDDATTDPAVFANLLTKQMQDVSGDNELEIDYSQTVTPDRPPGPTPETLVRYREAMKQANCTFEEVKILPNNIGYLKLNSFPDTAVCQSTAVAAMTSLNHVNAIVFDLRDNGGGFPEMVSFIASYLFDHPEYMYNPRENTTANSWTRSPVVGNRLADKPVYILTSRRTISGAEQFSYDLKMLKRATLVGETTGGTAHAGVYHRLDEHFGIGIREANAVNPYAKTDWGQTGVQPDVRVNAAAALSTAQGIAAARLRQRMLRKTRSNEEL